MKSKQNPSSGTQPASKPQLPSRDASPSQVFLQQQAPLELGTKVCILTTDNVLQRAPHLIGSIGIIKEVPVHPATWYKVQFENSRVMTFRPSALEAVSEENDEKKSKPSKPIRRNSVDLIESEGEEDMDADRSSSTPSVSKPVSRRKLSESDLGGGASKSPASMLEDKWIGKTVRITVGRGEKLIGKVLRTGNGWVQLQTKTGEVAKRAYELEIIDENGVAKKMKEKPNALAGDDITNEDLLNGEDGADEGQNGLSDNDQENPSIAGTDDKDGLVNGRHHQSNKSMAEDDDSSKRPKRRRNSFEKDSSKDFNTTGAALDGEVTDSSVRKKRAIKPSAVLQETLEESYDYAKSRRSGGGANRRSTGRTTDHTSEASGANGSARVSASRRSATGRDSFPAVPRSSPLPATATAANGNGSSPVPLSMPSSQDSGAGLLDMGAEHDYSNAANSNNNLGPPRHGTRSRTRGYSDLGMDDVSVTNNSSSTMTQSNAGKGGSSRQRAPPASEYGRSSLSSFKPAAANGDSANNGKKNPKISSTLRETKRMLVQRYVDKQVEKVKDRPDLTYWLRQINGVCQDSEFEYAEARPAFDNYCNVCYQEKWLGAKFCWNEMCSISSVYWKHPGARGHPPPTTTTAAVSATACAPTSDALVATEKAVDEHSNGETIGKGRFVISFGNSM